MSETILRGGQIWQQEKFPCFRVYATLLVTGNFVMLTHPDEQGSMQISRKEMGPKGGLPCAEMEAGLRADGYTLVGRYSEIRKAELEETWKAAQEALAMQKHPTRDPEAPSDEGNSGPRHAAHDR